MKLFYHPFSGNSRRVLLTVEHLGAEVERVLVDLTKGEQQAATHLARNPNGRVPVLEDDGFWLWESRAIMLYLCERTAGQTLLPTDAKGRADVQRWLFWCSGHMAPANTIIVFENFVKKFQGKEPDPTELARGEADFAKYAGILDAHLAGKTWVAQDQLTLADYSLAAGFALAGPARMPIEPFTNVRAWLGRVTELPAWQKTAPKF